MCGEGRFPFIESANWSDKILQEGWKMMSNWHYVDRTFKPGEKNDNETTKILNKEENLVWAIESTVSHLKYKNTSRRSRTNPLLGKSLDLRNLIHFVGDIHQPLHDGTRITKEFPDGDQGGNLFKVDRGPDATKFASTLHFVWDHMFDQFDQNISSPLEEGEEIRVGGFVEEIESEFSFEALRPVLEQNSTPESWALESYDLVKNFVYENIRNGEKLPKDYIEKGRRITRERIALGGYRLANLIQYIYENLSKETTK